MSVITTVATPSASQTRIAADAALPRTLMGGTKAMRAAGETYLPKEQGESDAGYKARLKRSFLFNAFGKTVDDMTGKVFNKPVVLGEDVLPEIATYAENIDLAGRHLNVFARDVLHDAMQSGVGYILVDMPVRPEGLPQTVAAEKDAGIRPYLVYITAENLIGWKSETVNGVELLTQVRIREAITEPDGEFGEKSVEQIRVLEPGTWRTFRKSTESGKSEEWTLHDKGVNSLLKITLVPVYTNRTGFMTGSPPLAKLAELNVEHWQSSSDQRNILHVARVPVLFGAGFDEKDELTIGAGSMVRVSDPAAKLTYVEHSGAAIGAGRDDIKDLEFRMQVMGLQLLVPNPGQTATGEIRDDAKENSPLAMIARGLGDAIEAAFGFMAEYDGKGEKAGGSVQVNTDFGIQAGAASDLSSITSAFSSGLIDQETALEEFKRRGFLSDAVEIEKVMTRTAAEQAKMQEREMALGD